MYSDPIYSPSIRHQSSTALLPGLNRRTLHIAVRTIDAAIALERFQQRSAAFAVVVELTRVGWHQVLRPMTAFRARQCRVGFNHYRGSLYRGKCRLQRNELSQGNPPAISPSTSIEFRCCNDSLDCGKGAGSIFSFTVENKPGTFSRQTRHADRPIRRGTRGDSEGIRPFRHRGAGMSHKKAPPTGGA